MKKNIFTNTSMTKNINVIVIIICALLIIFLTVLSYQAITLNDYWEYSFDFEDKNNTISSYSSLSTTIVGLLSIILLIYTILTQLRQFKKQNKQFKKQFLLQHEQFEEEKKRADLEEIKDMFFKLKLVDSLLITFIKHLKLMSEEIKNYFEFEKSNPLLHVNLQFSVNRDAERLNSMESLELFKAFQYFFETDREDFVSIFTEIFSLVTFYESVLTEMNLNNKNHVKEKYNYKVEIATDLNLIIETAHKIIRSYKINENHKDLPYYRNVQDLIINYYKYISDLNKKESDIDEISQKILLQFLNSVSPLIENPKDDNFGIIELIDMISAIRKRIFFVKSTASIYASNMENRFEDYFSEKNVHLSELERLQKILHEKINSIIIS